MPEEKTLLTRPEAAVRAWLVFIRKGYASRSMAVSLCDLFEAPRAEWEAALLDVRKTSGYEHLVAEARSRFDLVL